MYSLFMLGEQRRIVAYLDGLQAKVNALRERWLSSPERSLRARIETTVCERGEWVRQVKINVLNEILGAWSNRSQ